MRLKRENVFNFTLIILVALILFTPIGFHTRVFVSRIFSFSPSALDEAEQLMLSDYNWELSNRKAQILNFSEFEEKVVLVNFWATWCPPCVAEMPSLQNLYLDYGNEVAFVFVAHDKVHKVNSFLKSNGYDLPVYFENSSPPNALNTKNIPTTFLIDKKGNIVIQKVGAANWNSQTTREFIEDLINE